MPTVFRNCKIYDAKCQKPDALIPSYSKFKVPPGRRSEVAKSASFERSDKQGNVSSQIGPFANMVLNATQVAYRCEWASKLTTLRADTFL